MPSWSNIRKTESLGLTALTLCLSTWLPASAQDTPAPSSNPPASVVLPPTDTRPTTPLAMPATQPKPHAILLPPPPDDPTPAVKAVAKKPAPAKKAAPAATQTTTVTSKPNSVSAPAMTTATVPAPASVPTGIPAAAPLTQNAGANSASVPQATDAPIMKGANTFGFYSGETHDQIVAAIGKDNVLRQSGDILEVAASPKPDPGFETFLLIVGPQQGLVKLIATGKDIDGDPAGRQMKEQFTALRTSLGAGYGDPSDNFDFLNAKATHRSGNQFMLSLTNQERSLATYWTKKDFGNEITSISLEGNGLGSEKGYLSLEYEFAGYHAYLLAKK